MGGCSSMASIIGPSSGFTGRQDSASGIMRTRTESQQLVSGPISRRWSDMSAFR